MGDTFLVEFTSALEAIEYAGEIQKILHEYNEVPRGFSVQASRPV